MVNLSSVVALSLYLPVLALGQLSQFGVAVTNVDLHRQTIDFETGAANELTTFKIEAIDFCRGEAQQRRFLGEIYPTSTVQGIIPDDSSALQGIPGGASFLSFKFVEGIGDNPDIYRAIDAGHTEAMVAFCLQFGLYVQDVLVNFAEVKLSFNLKLQTQMNDVVPLMIEMEQPTVAPTSVPTAALTTAPTAPPYFTATPQPTVAPLPAPTVPNQPVLTVPSVTEPPIMVSMPPAVVPAPPLVNVVEDVEELVNIVTQTIGSDPLQQEIFEDVTEEEVLAEVFQLAKTALAALATETLETRNGTVGVVVGGKFASGRVGTDGKFEPGIVVNGTFSPGVFVDGESGTFVGNEFVPGQYTNETFVPGHTVNGTFVPGVFVGGELGSFVGDTFVTGQWINGTFHPGITVNGTFQEGIYVNGQTGIFLGDSDEFVPGRWLNNTFDPGTFSVNGTWVSGLFNEDGEPLTELQLTTASDKLIVQNAYFCTANRVELNVTQFEVLDGNGRLQVCFEGAFSDYKVSSIHVELEELVPEESFLNVNETVAAVNSTTEQEDTEAIVYAPSDPLLNFTCVSTLCSVEFQSDPSFHYMARKTFDDDSNTTLADLIVTLSEVEKNVNYTDNTNSTVMNDGEGEEILVNQRNLFRGYLRGVGLSADSLMENRSDYPY